MRLLRPPRASHHKDIRNIVLRTKNRVQARPETQTLLRTRNEADVSSAVSLNAAEGIGTATVRSKRMEAAMEDATETGHDEAALFSRSRTVRVFSFWTGCFPAATAGSGSSTLAFGSISRAQCPVESQ
jgi:hypothetical protein